MENLHHQRVDITIVTQTINGCVYKHPYFAFYDLREDRKSVTVNPLQINLGSDQLHKLTQVSEGIYNILYVCKRFHVYYFLFKFQTIFTSRDAEKRRTFKKSTYTTFSLVRFRYVKKDYKATLHISILIL